jgi:hypothetical protein
MKAETIRIVFFIGNLRNMALRIRLRILHIYYITRVRIVKEKIIR